MIENLIFPLDYIVLAIGTIIIIFCFWKGIIGSVLGLLTWIGSIIITIYFYSDLSNFINTQLYNINLLKNYEQITNLLSIIISIPLIFLISLFILKKLRKIISSDLDKQVFGILIDKLFGFIFGFLFNYIIFSTLIYFTNNFEFLNLFNEWLKENSFILNRLNDFNNDLLYFIRGDEEINSS
tara:strand:+ start:1287 stop:1832 length:546 start_codon:yes stop_codon:yes gene_type:complete